MDRRYRWRDPDTGILYKVHEVDGWQYFTELPEPFRKRPYRQPPSYSSTKVRTTHHVVEVRDPRDVVKK